jgi:chromosome segregation ATPase
MVVNRIGSPANPLRPVFSATPSAAPRPAADAVLGSGSATQAADPFKDPKTYVSAVEAAENSLESARTKQRTAEATRATVDAETQEVLDKAIAAREAKNSDAVKPLDAAKAAREAKHRELQAPIDRSDTQLSQANEALVDAKFPNKRTLDRARSEARSEVSRSEGSLQQAQTSLDAAVAQLDKANRELSTNRNGLAQTRADLSATQSRLSSARSSLSSARFSAPSSYEFDRVRADLDQAERDHRAAESEVRSARSRVTDRRRELDRLLDEESRPTPPGSGYDRPTPPGSGNDRPTPPGSGYDRPTPPGSGYDRPTPPSGGSSDRPVPPGAYSSTLGTVTQGSVSEARAALAAAERELDRAEDRLSSAAWTLDDVRRRYNNMRASLDEVSRWETTVRGLESQVVTLQSNVSVYDQNIRTLESRLPRLEQDRSAATRARDEAARALSDAKDRSQKLDATPYDNGDPALIKAAQGKVDRIADELAGHRKTYTEGMKAPNDRVSREQATFDQAMAPFHQAVTQAEQARKNGLAEADRQLNDAKGAVKRGEDEITRLKDVPGGKAFKWKMPKWLGGSSFDVEKFWKDRPAV